MILVTFDHSRNEGCLIVLAVCSVSSSQSRQIFIAVKRLRWLLVELELFVWSQNENGNLGHTCVLQCGANFVNVLLVKYSVFLNCTIRTS